MRCDLAVARQSPLHRALPDSADQAKAHRSQYGQLRVWAIGAASFPAFAATVQSDRPRHAARPGHDWVADLPARRRCRRSEEHTSELQSLMRISYAVFCLKKKKYTKKNTTSKIRDRNTKHK